MESARRNLLVVACLLATSDAHADSVVASMGYDHAWYVHRIAEGKVKKLDAGKDAIAMVFSDAHTLWVLRSVKGKLAIVQITDAKAAVERKLDLDGLQNAYTPMSPASLVATSDGSVWLVGCNPVTSTDVCKRLYLRVDTNAFTVARSHPKAIDTYAKHPEPVEQPPAGYKMQMPHSKKPVEYTINCIGPGGQHSYGSYNQRVKATWWLSAKPVIARIDVGGTSDCDGEDLLEGNCEPGSIFVTNCKDVVDDVRALPDGVLAISTDSKNWQLYRGGKVIGTLPGGAELLVAP